MREKLLKIFSNIDLRLIALFSLIIIAINSIFLHKPVIGILMTGIYLISCSLFLTTFFHKKIVGLFLTLYSIAISLAIPIFFYKINIYYFYIFLFIFTFILFFLPASKIYFKKGLIHQFQTRSLSKIFYYIFGFCYFILFYLLIKARTGKFIFSPWQVIARPYLYLWFIVLFLLFIFILFEKNKKLILILIIFVSLLSHAYIPFVYKVGCGVDSWYHLGAERRLIMGKAEPPSLADRGMELKKIGFLKIPEIFISGTKSSYSATWGMTIALSWLTGLDIFLIDKYLIFIIWSIFLPIFIFEIGFCIFKKRRLALLAAFMSLLIYPFQIAGAITLPNHFAFLVFVFFLWMLIRFLEKPSKKLFWLIIFLIISFYFNYLVYFVLSLEFFIFSLFLKNFSFKSIKKRIMFISVLLVSSVSFCILDSISGFSYFPYKKLPGIFAIYLHRLAIFFTILVKGAYLYFSKEQVILSNFMPLHFHWNLIFSPIVLGLIISSIIILRKKILANKLLFLIFGFLIIIFTNLFISNAFMWGLRIFVKRLTLSFCLLILFFLAYIVYFLIENQKMFKRKILFSLLIGFFLCFFAVTTYTSGVYLDALTEDQYKVANFIKQDIQNNNKYCVLAHGEQNLAIQSTTGNIIAGGFPCLAPQCAQPERINLLAAMIANPRPGHMNNALRITGANICYFIIDKNELGTRELSQAKDFFGEPKIINNIYIWKYKNSNL